MKAGSRRRSDRPQYQDLRDKLIKRILAGDWPPGSAIPSEVAIAEEYGVAQGTARKAIGALAELNLVIRKQGLGTFVFAHTPENIMTRFFGLYEEKHELISPASEQMKVERGAPTPAERSGLDLGGKARVVRIRRVRTHKGKPFIVETISVPESVFPNLSQGHEVPNTLYDFYQKVHRVLVVRAEERLRPVVADRATAKALGLAAGSPLLRIERIAYALDDAPVEWRMRLCHLGEGYYLSHRT